MIVQVFSLFDQAGPFVERAAKSLRILADKAGERILAKDHYCVVKVSLYPPEYVSVSPEPFSRAAAV